MTFRVTILKLLLSLQSCMSNTRRGAMQPSPSRPVAGPFPHHHDSNSSLSSLVQPQALTHCSETTIQDAINSVCNESRTKGGNKAVLTIHLTPDIYTFNITNIISRENRTFPPKKRKIVDHTRLFNEKRADEYSLLRQVIWNYA